MRDENVDFRPLSKNIPTYKHHTFAPTASARSSTSSKLCAVVEDVETILKDVNHFSIQRILFLQGAPKKFAVNDRRAVFLQYPRNL